jgi:hypothetical protein
MSAKQVLIFLIYIVPFTAFLVIALLVTWYEVAGTATQAAF